MTDRELLESIAGKIKEIKDELKDDIKSLRNEFKDDIQSLRDEFKGDIQSLKDEFKSDIQSLKDEFEEKMVAVESRLSEHSEILIALRHASEVQHAKFDNLEIELAKLSGEQKEAFRALADMYGQHELEITKLKRKPV